MAVRVGINGFGRIGRQSLKALIERAPDVEVVAVNDLVDTKLNAFLFKHDSAMAPIPARWTTPENALIIDGREIKVLKERDPAVLPWGDLGVDIVLESTGIFTDADKATAHLTAGAKKVIISAPAKGEDITIVLGVNEGRYDPAAHHTSQCQLHHELPAPDGQGRPPPGDRLLSAGSRGGVPFVRERGPVARRRG
jgi:glyceraldehyde 3-phosphate dehydrogenase